MISKLSLFNLNQATLQAKLKKSGINQATLLDDLEINFYINRLDSRDYYILVNQTISKDQYFSDFIDSSMFDYSATIEDVIHYINNELKERYLLGNEKFETYTMQAIELKSIEKLKGQFKASQYKNSIITKEYKTLQKEKESIKHELDKLNEKLSIIKSIAV